MSPYFYPAKLISYDKDVRTAQIAIKGLTDGEPNGLKALLAYPIGDDDKDTERELIAGADVWVFFENGDIASPIIAFYRSHGEGALVDIRRIRQENIEVLARNHIEISATEDIEINTKTMTINANLVINGDIKHTGNQDTTGKVTATEDVVAGTISLKTHKHSGVVFGNSLTQSPNP